MVGVVDKRKREELIVKYVPLVKNIVGRIAARLPIDMADKEDLVNVGIMGLMAALEKFDEKRNVQFEAYAIFRIRVRQGNLQKKGFIAILKISIQHLLRFN